MLIPFGNKLSLLLMNNPLFENPYQWVVVLFLSKKQISGKKNHSYFLFKSRRSVFENTYDSISKGTNSNPGNASSGVNEKNFSSD